MMSGIENMILAMVSNKGGVAKTTTATSLAAGIAREGRRVLLIDLDSQGSASLSMGVSRRDLTPSIADVLFSGRPMRGAVRETSVPGLALVTGSMELADADLVLAGMRGRETRLTEALEPVLSSYDFVVVDCQPSLSLMPVNALVAADAYIVPVVPQYLALEGLVNLLEAVERVEGWTGRGALLLGILLTVVDYRPRVTWEIVETIRGRYRNLVFNTEIRINTRLAEAPSSGQPIFDYAPSSTGAECYTDLTTEVLWRCRMSTYT